MVKKRFVLTLVLFSLVISVCASGKENNSAIGQIRVSDNKEGGLAKLKALAGDDIDSSEGFFHYLPADGTGEVRIKLAYVKVDGKYAWFAGECTQNGVNLIGRWFFGAVHDGGKPGKLVDHIWWEWLPDSDNARSVAKSKVENFEIPAENKTIIDGDIAVK
ncbi:hypothetical protein ACFL1G_04675 [Planctomycetota bacterium]